MTRTVSAFAAVFPDWEAADIQARAKNTPLHTNIDSVLANLRPGKIVAEVEFDVPDDAVFLIAHPLGGPVIHGADLEDVIDAGAADLPELAEPRRIHYPHPELHPAERASTPALRIRGSSFS